MPGAGRKQKTTTTTASSAPCMMPPKTPRAERLRGWYITLLERSKELGTGHEVGQLKPSDPAKANDPRLKAISKRFGMLHGLSVSINLVALCAAAAHGVMYIA